MRPDPLAYLATELDSLKQQGLYRRLRILEDEQKPKTTFDHRQVVNLSSNNYLGLTTHPRLREAALEATRRLGVGSGSVRTIAGTMDIHMELERRLAAFKKTEAAVVRSIISACTAASTSRWARCRRRSARSAATSPAAARSSSFCITARGRSCSRRRIRRRLRRRASRRWTSSSRSRS